MNEGSKKIRILRLIRHFPETLTCDVFCTLTSLRLGCWRLILRLSVCLCLSFNYNLQPLGFTGSPSLDFWVTMNFIEHEFGFVHVFSFHVRIFVVLRQDLLFITSYFFNFSQVFRRCLDSQFEENRNNDWDDWRYWYTFTTEVPNDYQNSGRRTNFL